MYNFYGRSFVCHYSGLVIREEIGKLDNKQFDEQAKLPKGRRAAKECCKKPQ